MSEIVFAVEEATEGGYTVRAIIEADTCDELRSMARDATGAHFGEDAAERPLAIRLAPANGA